MIKALAGNVARKIAAEVGAGEVMLIVALAFIARGMWEVWTPGVYLAPGTVLLYLALPTRRPFIERAPEAIDQKRKG